MMDDIRGERKTESSFEEDSVLLFGETVWKLFGTGWKPIGKWLETVIRLCVTG